jgi:hypothetical protein
MSDVVNFMRWYESHESQGNQHTLTNKVLYALATEAGHEVPKRKLTDQDIFDAVHEMVDVADKSPLQRRLHGVLFPEHQSVADLVAMLDDVCRDVGIAAANPKTVAVDPDLPRRTEIALRSLRYARECINPPPPRVAQPVLEGAGARHRKYRKSQIFWTNLGLGWRTADALVGLDVMDIWELEYLPEATLASRFRVGPQSLARVKALAAKHNLVLGRVARTSRKNWREDLLAARLQKRDTGT